MRCSVTRPSFRYATRCLIAVILWWRVAGYQQPSLVLRSRRRLIDAHAEAEAHRVQDFLDLVQALAPEVLRLQHLGFGLLYELANRPDVRILQAVVRADRELEL